MTPEGTSDPFVHDTHDAVDTIHWIRSQAWSDGRVVMVGESYSGLLQFQAASARPPGLRAIAPTVSGALVPGWTAGGTMALARIDLWLRRLLLAKADRAGALPAELHGLEAASPRELFHEFLTPGTAAFQLGEPLRHWISSADDEAWRSAIALPADPVPAVHTTGQYDLCSIPAIQAFQKWSAAEARVPQLLTFGPWGHSVGELLGSSVLGLSPTDVPGAHMARERKLRFFEKALNSEATIEGPLVMSFVIGRNRWHQGNCWPPIGTRSHELRLAVDGHDQYVLARERSIANRVVRYRYDPSDPVPTHGGANAVVGRSGPADQAPIERRADVLVFTSRVLEDPVEIAGCPVVRLVVSSSAVATTFLARLTHVLPDMTSLNLSEGSWSGPIRRLPQAEGLAERICEITLGPVHVWIASAYRLRLQITSSNAPELYPHPNTDHDFRDGPPPRTITAEQRIVVGGESGSTLTLPVVSSRAWNPTLLP